MSHTGWAPMPVAEVAVMLTGCGARWWLSGGCAIDHWAGRRTREHGDIDVSTQRPDLEHVLAALPLGLEPFGAERGDLRPLADTSTNPHNIWIRDTARDRWVLQVNLEGGDASSWRYRRDPRITRPWPEAVAEHRGIPTGTPATQLLWKSRTPRPCDDHDRVVIDPLLSVVERRWLQDAIRTAHPDSPWAGDQPPGGQRATPFGPTIGP